MSNKKSSEIILEYVIHNHDSVAAENFDNSLTSKTPGVYEVIRVIDGIPLFFEKHMSRFRSSSKLLGYELKNSDSYFEKSLNELIKLNNCSLGNIKIVVNNLENQEQDCYFFFIKSKYPTVEEIENGVHTILFHVERENPNAKSTNLGYRKRIVEEIQKSGAHEALLVNRNNDITEGSKSNFFAVKYKNVYTPPIESVLPGVTRGLVIEICKKMGFLVYEKAISVSDLESFDGVFMTGTSPQVLPISSIGDLKFESPSNETITNIRKAYEKEVQNYIQSKK